MRLFVTGASGFIGRAVIPELLAAGHGVLGLARSAAAARAVTSAGADVHRGELADLASLEAGARATDGVIHLGFIHDFTDFEASLRTDLAAIERLGAVLEGSGRPFVVASGTLGIAPGRLATEDMPYDARSNPRSVNALAALGFEERGVRVSLMRFAPTVHGEGDHGFVRRFVEIAREKGASAHIGDGSNRWNAVHRLDAARLIRLAAENAPAGSVYHAVGEESIPTRDIAAAIGRKLGVPVVSIAPDAAAAHFGWLSWPLSLDQPASSALTRERLKWTPTHPTLAEDLAQDHYFT
ncbi:MAG TPA: SDR family oxidoreductase [Polyangia bacterium]|nr:SDR family oxidoreductase [Polyangia bacterium]